MVDVSLINESYAAFKGRLSSLSPMALMRRDRLASAAASIGFPNTKNEDWRYTSLRGFLSQEFKVPTKSEKTESVDHNFADLDKYLIPNVMKLVFVDGVLSIALSDTRKFGSAVQIQTLFEAEGQNDNFWDDLNSVQGMQSVFSQIAVAFSDHGVLIKVSPRAEGKIIIQIVHVSTGNSKGLSRSTRNVIDVQRLSNVTVFEDFVAPEGLSSHLNSLTQIVAREGSSVGYYRVDQSGKSFYSTGQVTVMLERDAKVETFSLALGSKFNRTNIDVLYTAPGGECLLDGLYLLNDDQIIDHHTSVDHAVPHCLTKQLYKGVLKGKSRAVFNGKVFIRRGASNTQAYQSNKNLLLSQDAEVDTKPELLIDNDDVKATHGAAVGALNPKEVFYLQSRGLDKEEAEAILSRGFADEVVLRVEDLEAMAILSDRVKLWYSSSATKE
jgi:Fe-S cluster assembly protein SufD